MDSLSVCKDFLDAKMAQHLVYQCSQPFLSSKLLKISLCLFVFCVAFALSSKTGSILAG